MFEVHILNSAGIAKAEILQKCFQSFLETLEGVMGTSGREVSVVRTKLEEASFFAKRAMAMLPENQENKDG